MSAHHPQFNPSHAHPQRGIALIITMFVLFFLSSLALSYAFAIQLETALVRNYRDDMQAQYLARAGVYVALGELRNQQRVGHFAYPRADIPEDAERIERYQEIFLNVPLGDGFYSVKFRDNFGQTGLGPMDESSLIDINALASASNRDALRELFSVATENRSTITKLIDCLIDYVDSDDIPHLSGAERDCYERLDPPEYIRNAPMRDPSEFLSILNVMQDKFPGEVDDTVWFGRSNEEDVEEDTRRTINRRWDEPDLTGRGIKDYVTVYTGSSSVNPNTASREVLSIIIPERVEEIMEEREFGPVAGNSTTFRIRSYGIANDYAHAIEWIVRVGGDAGYPTVLRMQTR